MEDSVSNLKSDDGKQEVNLNLIILILYFKLIKYFLNNDLPNGFIWGMVKIIKEKVLLCCRTTTFVCYSPIT